VDKSSKINVENVDNSNGYIVNQKVKVFKNVDNYVDNFFENGKKIRSYPHIHTPTIITIKETDLKLRL